MYRFDDKKNDLDPLDSQSGSVSVHKLNHLLDGKEQINSSYYISRYGS